MSSRPPSNDKKNFQSKIFDLFDPLGRPKWPKVSFYRGNCKVIFEHLGGPRCHKKVKLAKVSFCRRKKAKQGRQGMLIAKNTKLFNGFPALTRGPVDLAWPIGTPQYNWIPKGIQVRRNKTQGLGIGTEDCGRGSDTPNGQQVGPANF